MFIPYRRDETHFLGSAQIITGENHMFKSHQFSLPRGGVAFVVAFGLCVFLGAVLSLVQPVVAAPHYSSTHPSELAIQVAVQVTSTGEYRGPELCSGCHKDIHTEWTTTRHAAAFSSPIFGSARSSSYDP